jgi:hypothetical protein
LASWLIPAGAARLASLVGGRKGHRAMAVGINALRTFPNASLTNRRQSPLFPILFLDKNKQRTYKNIIATREMQMLTFIKDFAAFVTLGAFTIGSLTWMDVITRLV